jgi:hypothetical protein
MKIAAEDKDTTLRLAIDVHAVQCSFCAPFLLLNLRPGANL